jgi:predicted nuclease with TOPRIM domain
METNFKQQLAADIAHLRASLTLHSKLEDLRRLADIEERLREIGNLEHAAVEAKKQVEAPAEGSKELETAKAELADVKKKTAAMREEHDHLVKEVESVKIQHHDLREHYGRHEPAPKTKKS